MVSYEKKLPIERYQHVLRNVSCGDLCNVMLTSRHMNSVASWPELWVGMRVNMGKAKKNGLAQLYSIHRFKRVKEIDFRGTHFNSWDLERIFTDIPRSPLESVNFTGIVLDHFPPVVPHELLANVVGRLKTVSLRNTQLSRDQRIKVLEAIQSSTSLVDVDLSYVDLSCSEGEMYYDQNDMTQNDMTHILLANAISRLKNVKLANSRLTTEQCIKVLKASISSTTLISIDLSGIDLSRVPFNLLESAVSCLKTMYVSDTHLTTYQCIKALEASISSTTLISLDLSAIDLSRVPPNLLASAVSHLKTVKLNNATLTSEQCTEVLKASISSTTLKSLHLGHVNLSGVPANSLASAVSRLTTVDLVSTRLTPDQCDAVLRGISSSNTLTHVNLRGNKIPTSLRNLNISMPSHITFDLCGLNKTNL